MAAAARAQITQIAIKKINIKIYKQQQRRGEI